MIIQTQVQTRLKTQSFNNLPDEFQQFLITAQGKYMQLNARCPHCGGSHVVHNGYYECEAQLIKALGLNVKHGHYLCKTCGKSFSTKFPGLQLFLNDLHKFLAETCFKLYLDGLSFGAIANYIKEHFCISLSKETVRQYYKEIAAQYKKMNVLEASGFFNVDCQHLKVNGEKTYRLTIMDAVNKKCVTDVIITAETNSEIIDRLRLSLLPFTIKGFIVDGKMGLDDELEKEFKVPVQRCIFHVQQIIVRDYINKYKKMNLLQLRNMYMMLSIFVNHDAEVQFLNQKINEKVINQDDKKRLEEFYEFRKDLRKFRRKQDVYLIVRTEEEMIEKLEEAKKFLIEKHEIRRLKKIEKKWNKVTQFLHIDGLPPTNNTVEHYYSKTLSKTEKKKFRDLYAIKEKITACRVVFNNWFKPTISLKEILQRFARLFLYFSA